MENELLVFPNAEEVSIAAAKLVVDLADRAIQQNGRFTLVLSGGSTPNGLYAHLAQPPFHDEIAWSKVFVFWGDERCVPENDAQNNAHQAKSILLDLVPIPSINIFRIDSSASPVAAAIEYERTIVEFFEGEKPHFDLILLGLGENGHTASLFPGTPAIEEKNRLVTEVFVPELNKSRITMTARLINNAANVVFMVTGERKAEILKKLFSDSNENEKFPAQLIHPVDGRLRWMADAKAASLIV